MLAMVLSIIGLVLFVAMVAWFYVWTRRTESDMDFEQAAGIKTEEQANAIRLGIMLNTNGSFLGGR